MKIAASSLAGLAALSLALAACTTVVESAPPAKSHSASSAPASSASPSSSAPASTSPSAAPSRRRRRRRTSPIPGPSCRLTTATSSPATTSRRGPCSASGATTGQTYQQFVDGFTCTGWQDLSEQSASGNQVTFSLSATDTCNGQVQHFTGTDTVENGKIVGADVTRTQGTGQSRSMTVTLAWPPPSHMVSSPYRPPVRSSDEQQRRQQPGAGRAERMAERDRAAADVDPVQVAPVSRCQAARPTGERLVDLDQVDLAELEAGALQRVRGRRDRRGEHQDRSSPRALRW